MNNIHIGSIIKQKLAENSMTIKDFSEKINCDRTTVYDIFKRKSIDVEQLMRISQALKYNFLEEVYLKRTTINVPASQRIIIGVEIDKSVLPKLDLPDAFILLIKPE
ncbi:MAG: helix-turn-helix transcriptional regulator [Dysgonamonadaceae bacterium]|jgi:predicted transcriptional regulator|nr:helix-turn-helix transcriptional regulator [Dysgonamonadaceae bacterium]